MLAQIKDDCCSKRLIEVNRPLTENCIVEACEFDQDAFWHSSAHILGYAIELNYLDAKLAHGPPVDQGFFYDFGTS
jgi:threonyl-tRNA synthetase